MILSPLRLLLVSTRDLKCDIMWVFTLIHFWIDKIFFFFEKTVDDLLNWYVTPDYNVIMLAFSIVAVINFLEDKNLSPAVPFLHNFSKFLWKYFLQIYTIKHFPTWFCAFYFILFFIFVLLPFFCSLLQSSKQSVFFISFSWYFASIVWM